MPTECERLIAETLRLDAEATKGPWNVKPMSFMIDNGDFDIADTCPTESTPILAECFGNARAIVGFRTSAPRLARMLQVAIDALTEIDDRFSRETITEIERIAKEE